MNIAFITPKMIIGGAETYIITKAKYLCDNGHNVLVISEGGENVKNIPLAATHVTLPTDTTPYHLSKQQFKRVTDQIYEVLIAHKIDVVEAHNTYAILYASMACRKANIPCLYNLLNELSHKKQIVTNGLLRSFSKSGCYFTLTSQMNSYVEHAIHTRLKPIIIPIPVQEIELRSASISDNYILSVCRFSSDKMYVLSLIKGYGNAILNGVISKDITLKIVGDGDLRLLVEQAAEQTNQQIGRHAVVLLGTKTDGELSDLFSRCTLYVGMGTTILLAAQYKKTIIKVGFQSDMITQSWGYWGDNVHDAKCIVADKNKDQATSFENSLKIVNFKDKLHFYGNKAYQTYHDNYQLSTIMERWSEQYHKVSVKKNILPLSTVRSIECKLFFLRFIKKAQRIIMR